MSQIEMFDLIFRLAVHIVQSIGRTMSFLLSIINQVIYKNLLIKSVHIT